MEPTYNSQLEDSRASETNPNLSSIFSVGCAATSYLIESMYKILRVKIDTHIA